MESDPTRGLSACPKVRVPDHWAKQTGRRAGLPLQRVEGTYLAPLVHQSSNTRREESLYSLGGPCSWLDLLPDRKSWVAASSSSKLLMKIITLIMVIMQ